MTEAARLSVLVEAKGVGATRAQLGGLNSSLRASAKNALKLTAAYGGIATVGAAIVGTAKATAELEKNFSALKATTGASAKQMAAFKGQAIQASFKRLGFSAAQAAQAQTELAKGGLSVRQILGGGLKGTLALAAAGEMELAQAASTTANALNLFGLSGKDAGHVADALATAANATTADVADFAMALTQGGAAAKLAGMSFDQTIVALEALAKAGVKNSDAGTSLKAALTHLAKPSDEAAAKMKELGLDFFNAGGSIKSVASMSDMLRDKMGRLNEEQRLQALTTIAGTDGLRALAAMFDLGGKGAEKLSRGIKAQGTAMDQAKKRNDNLAGSWDQLKNTVKTGAALLGEKAAPAIRDATGAAAKFVRQMVRGKGAGGDFVDKAKEIGSAIGDVVRPIAKAAGNLGKFFADHPRLIAIGVAAWATYKAAMLAATTLSKARAAAMFVGLGPAAGAAGGVAGNLMAGKLGTALKAFGWAGIGLMIANALGLDKVIAEKVQSAMKQAKEFIAPSKASGTTYLNRESLATVGATFMSELPNVSPRLAVELEVNNRDALAKIGESIGMLRKFGGMKPLARILANNRDAKTKVQQILNLIARIRDKSFTITGRYVPPQGMPAGASGGSRRGNDGGGGIGQPQNPSATGASARIAARRRPIRLTADEAVIAWQEKIIAGAQEESERLQRSFARADFRREQARLTRASKSKDKDTRAQAERDLRELRRQRTRERKLEAQDKRAAEAQRNIDRREKIMGRPSASDRATAAIGQASLTAGLGDDLKAARRLRNARRFEYQQALRTNDPRKIAQASQDLAAANQGLKDAAQAIKDAAQNLKDAAEAQRDRVATVHSAALVMAQVNTPGDKSDDLRALDKALTVQYGFYAAAVAAGDQEGIIKWGSSIMGLQQAIEDLNATTVESNEINQEQVDLLKAQVSDLQRQVNTGNAQAQQALDWISSALGQRVFRGATTPAAGRRGSL